MADLAAQRDERRALATLALMAFVVGVCVQPLVHNVHHRNDHVHTATGVAHSHPRVAKPPSPWVTHQQEGPPPGAPQHEDGKDTSNAHHGDGSWLHHALALVDAAVWTGEACGAVHQHAARHWVSQVLVDARRGLNCAWPQGPPA